MSVWCHFNLKVALAHASMNYLLPAPALAIASASARMASWKDFMKPPSDSPLVNDSIIAAMLGNLGIVILGICSSCSFTFSLERFIPSSICLFASAMLGSLGNVTLGISILTSKFMFMFYLQIWLYIVVCLPEVCDIKVSHTMILPCLC